MHVMCVYVRMLTDEKPICFVIFNVCTYVCVYVYVCVCVCMWAEPVCFMVSEQSITATLAPRLRASFAQLRATASPLPITMMSQLNLCCPSNPSEISRAPVSLHTYTCVIYFPICQYNNFETHAYVQLRILSFICQLIKLFNYNKLFLDGLYILQTLIEKTLELFLRRRRVRVILQHVENYRRYFQNR